MVTVRCGSLKFTNIQAIIFDKDGTLEDSHNLARELGIRRARMLDAQIPGIGEPLLMAFGIQESNIEPTGLMAVGSRQENLIAAAAYIAETGRGWFESLKIAENSFAEADKYLPVNAQTSPLFAGSLDVLKLLSDAGLKLGILSSATTASVKNFVARCELSAYIQLMMGFDGGLSKPNPALFLQACQGLGVEAKATLMVGDSPGDIEMAQKAGSAGTIGICWGNPAVAHLEAADVAIAHLEDIQVENAL